MRWAARVSFRMYETVDWETFAARATSLIVGRGGIEVLTVRVGKTRPKGDVKPRGAKERGYAGQSEHITAKVSKKTSAFPSNDLRGRRSKIQGKDYSGPDRKEMERDEKTH